MTAMTVSPVPPISQRLFVILLMLSVHALLWFAWQSQIKFGLLRETPTTYLQLLQLPRQEPEPPHPKLEKSPTQQDKPNTHPVVSRKQANVASPTTKTITVTSNAPTIAIPNNANTPITSSEPEPAIHLDLDALRASALAMDKQRRPGEIEKMQNELRRDERIETRLGEGVKKAQAKDCRQAYSGLGLLALIPLAASAISDKVCKW
ncbi:hypothetical protein [Undibacterium sp. RuRC25W]|uniref:hypothetical protein n=1 Tax=Undibacterium sp. RuRC25W TaxID=3413047 RepID=UPI003BF160D9